MFTKTTFPNIALIMSSFFSIPKNFVNDLFSFNGERRRSTIVICSLLFLFPLFVNSLRHWVSGLYILIFFVAIFSINWREIRLRNEEKWFLAILALHVASDVFSNTLSGWTRASFNWLEADMRFLFAIPIYLRLRQAPRVWKWLVYALPIAGIVIGLHAIVDFLLKYFAGSVEMIFAEGIYGHIFLGNMAALLSVLSFVANKFIDSPTWRRLCILGAVMAACGAFVSVTRNAWLSLFVLYGIVFAIWLLGRKSKLKLHPFHSIGVLLIIGSVTTFIFSIDFVKARFTRIYAEPLAWFQADRSKPIEFTSLGYRLEQWKGAVYAFKEKPLTGHGVGNIGVVLNGYVNNGMVNELLYHEPANEGNPTHVHSAYFDYLASTGIVGFCLIVLVMLFPIVVAIKNWEKSGLAAKFVMLNGTAFLVASLTEVPFIRNNWSSVFLIFSTTFFLWMISNIYESESLESDYFKKNPNNEKVD